MCHTLCMIKIRKKTQRYQIDYKKKVFVYRNLHKNCWSIKQGGLVKAHATEFNLHTCSFEVNRKGRERVLREQRKNVHAGIKGYLGESTWDDFPEDMMMEATYNPYKHESFVLKSNDEPRWFADFIKMKPKKVLITPF